MTALGKVLALAQAQADEDEACEHLHGECPWFRAVHEGSGEKGVDSYCKPAAGSRAVPRLVIKASSPAQAIDEGQRSSSWAVEGDLTHCNDESHTPHSQVTLTPRTPEASTVPEPTVPPGGPGLFHIKGRELPPYVQHLWHHLAPKYGKHRAYGMAIGIVKKWAAGVNPGGWKTKSGKGKRTHADVRAAAARNVALWEKDKADAHKQSASHGGHHG